MVSRKIVTLLALSVLVMAGVAAVKAPSGPYMNLQVLPKDISEQRLDSIMKSYNKALGIGCSFCHAEVKNFPDSLDFASDEKPMKKDARKMMQMTIEINKQNFYYDKTERPEYLKVVTCKTCHRGDAYPAD